MLAVLDCLNQSGVRAWLDGGWGVDALLGEQTREHDDLDCVIALADATRAQDALADRGYVVTEDELPTRFVVRGGEDRRVDFHSVTFDDEGGGIQQLQDGTSWRYPPQGFSGTGLVDGQTVPCLSAEVQALCHFGYDPDEHDHHDMRQLADRFSIELTGPYRMRP